MLLTRFYRAEDYHQKYLLQRRDDLLAEFGSAYSPRTFADSTVAARLNGYLGGRGSPEQLQANERVQAAVRSAHRGTTYPLDQ